MSASAVEAVYEHGTLRLVEPESLPLREGQRVRVVVSPEPDILELAAAVYEGLTEEEVRQVESVALNRDRFFDPRTQP